MKNSLPLLNLSQTSPQLIRDSHNITGSGTTGRKAVGFRDFANARQHQPDSSQQDKSAYKVASYYTSMKHEASKSPDYESQAEANRVRNIKIDDIVKKANKKLNFIKKDKVKKFEERLKIFENLNTFIDIKDYIQQLNVLNHDTSKKKAVQLPPLQPMSTSSSPQQTMAHINSISTKQKLSRDPSPNHKGAASNNGSIILHNQPAGLSPATLSERLKAIRSNVSKFAAIKEEEALETDGKKDIYGMVLDKTNMMLTQLNEVDQKMPVTEDTDINNFYQELQTNLLYNNFERIDYGNVELQQEEMDYYKNLLAFRDEPESEDITDKKYYDHYKQRADKVISLLRKAAKNIFRKVGDAKKNMKVKFQTNDLIEEEIKINTEREQNNLKEDLRQEFEMYVSTKGLMDGSLERKQNVELDTHYQRMMKRVDDVLHTQEAIKTTEHMTTRETVEEAKATENHVNHEVTKAFKGYMKAILESAETQGDNFKNVKGDFIKRITKLEDAYDKEIQRLLPKTLDSIKMTLDTQMGGKSYLDKPVRKNYSRKMLNALMS